MLNHLRRDCWGCDNKYCGKTGRCTCQETKRERQRDKRKWKKDVKDGNA